MPEKRVTGIAWSGSNFFMFPSCLKDRKITGIALSGSNPFVRLKSFLSVSNHFVRLKSFFVARFVSGCLRNTALLRGFIALSGFRGGILSLAACRHCFGLKKFGWCRLEAFPDLREFCL
ncbi:hypothetical protein HMPREF1981_02617 [Bacteroides pyogenes F0041]|uniref:Uncharacterized protein n=1 Tax=Bacteroides pyogenes F0041 TaxID=1321819 RepID=U2DQ60_9BACE|nr:hypothetical protein HMPREF1981_02617 [Bacteroides pyogenes F0041]